MPHITLKPLDREETRQAIMAMRPEIGSAAHSELISMVEEVTGGVPLFIEEICQWIAENAASITDRLAPVGSLSRISVFEGILQARLEALGPAKDVARAAAVAGNRFNLELLHKLSPEYSDETIGNALDTLIEAGFLIRVRPSGEPDYGFRHALIRETIYNAMLRRRRQALHQSLFSAVGRDRNLAPWLGTAELAEHAERAALIEEAIDQFVIAGTESSSRSAMAEARQILEHALGLCERVAATDTRDALRLSAMVVLGPILTAVEGPNSAPARKLYEDGVVIARRRPVAERAKWFPIYWGWWFTDTVMDGERAEVVLSDLRDVEDAEVQLQARHCVWAIDFNLGRHDRCIAAVDVGLSLYEHGQGKANAALFGGHDARVCGLAHRALSLWFVGKPASAIHSMSEARSWAQQTGHAGSIAHAYLNEAMLHCYRRDFSALRSVIADLRHLTERHHMPALVAAAQIFEGWCDGNAGQVESGREKMRQGLGLHGEFQTPEDEPVYCGMLAELLTRTAEVDEALALLGSAAAQAEAGGSRFWLAELYRRRAELLLLQGDAEADVIAALEKSIAIAAEQSAVPFLVSAYETLQSSGLSPELSSRYRDRVERAKSVLEPGAALIVNPEPAVRH
ncbi:ATP-binding protein [Mesorhizobium muleiense]|uniref:ATP-binding protein n=1 Tax=Mesorhizobium muleiense TaxID=1004279 RepID=UPI003AFB70D6